MENFLKNKRIIILGSNSFAASALVTKLLESGAIVLGINRSPENHYIFRQHEWNFSSSNYKFLQADLNNNLSSITLSINEFAPNIVVDFAGQGMVAESWQNPEQWYLTNLVAKVRLHDVLRSLKTLDKYIRVSTPEVYGSSDKLISENNNYNPSTPYAVSHSAVDMSLATYYQRYNFPMIIARFANFYGPGQQLYRIIPRTIIYALLKKKLQLHGGGMAVRAFIYGTDVADAIIKTILLGKIGEIYHFSSDEFYTISDVVFNIAKKLNIDINDLVEITKDRPGKDHAYLMDSSKAKLQLDWIQKISLDEGIEETHKWILNNFNHIKTLPLEYLHKK